jgi:hypothetical protein
MCGPASRRSVAVMPTGFQHFPERTYEGPAWTPALLYAAFAVFAGLVALLSGESAHRLWGTFAAVAYAGAALACLWRPARTRRLPLAIALTGAVLAPLGWLTSTGAAMPEVGVVERSAAMLVHHGAMYQSSGTLAASHQVYGYDPYLPVMMVFGLPRALFGPSVATDPRVWDGLVFAVLVAVSLWLAGNRSAVRHTALVVASPLIAFPLTVSGNDLPVIGLICLGLSFAGRPGPVPGAAAGLALGGAAAMKATAWPVLLIVAVLFAVRDGTRTAGRFAVTALAVVAVTAGPILAIEPAALIQNTIMFPLGLTRTVSPAASPLPGHLLAATGPAGHTAAIALLVTAAGVLAAVLLRRPPRTLAAAGWFLVLALTVMFALAPATRWGYFVYPLGIGAWLVLSRAGLTARGQEPRWLPAWNGRSLLPRPYRGRDSPPGAARAAAPRCSHPAGPPAG